MNMPWVNGLRIGLSLSLVVIGYSLAEAAETGNVETEVMTRESAFAAAMADRDLNAFFTFLSQEAVFFAGNEPLVGPQEILEAWAPFFLIL